MSQKICSIGKTSCKLVVVESIIIKDQEYETCHNSNYDIRFFIQ